jgi:hypothetical protein
LALVLTALSVVDVTSCEAGLDLVATPPDTPIIPEIDRRDVIASWRSSRSSSSSSSSSDGW